ncbi:MAG: lysozyme inhibitor LprI family protein [Betaproteobacteria bacterium]
MNRRSNVRPSLMRAGLLLVAGLALSGAARADALDECYRKALNNTEVVPCLEAARKHAEAEMMAANRRVEAMLVELERQTAMKTLAASVRKAQAAFTPYMNAQCKLVEATFASGGGSGKAGLACQVDLLRARTAELDKLAPPAARQP